MREGNRARATTAAPIPAIGSSATMVRLTNAENDLAKARHDKSLEEAAMTSALAAAQGAAKDSDAWTAAQLQLTRLDTLAARFDDLAPGVDMIVRDAKNADGPTSTRASALAAGLARDRATLSRLTQAARDALAR